jgi:hypothetical protein
LSGVNWVSSEMACATPETASAEEAIQRCNAVRAVRR